MLHNAMVRFRLFQHHEGLRSNVVSGGVKFQGKKGYVALEWPLTHLLSKQ